MERKMEKIEYDLDPLDLDNSNHEGKNVLLTICENSQESGEMILPNTEDIHYELRNSDGVLQYRFLNPSTINNNTNTVAVSNGNNNLANIAVGGTTAQTAIICNPTSTIPTPNCQFFVINEVSSASRPCLISPKVTTTTEITEEKPIVIGNSKKRDEKRRATHNEVERRRRDKINQWIFKLRDLLPDNSDSDTKSKASTNEYSKGGILIRACEYIRTIKEENQSYQECLKENEHLHSENASLREEIVKLRKENDHLKIMFSAKNIKMENNDINFEIS